MYVCIKDVLGSMYVRNVKWEVDGREKSQVHKIIDKSEPATSAYSTWFTLNHRFDIWYFNWPVSSENISHYIYSGIYLRVYEGMKVHLWCGFM